MVQNTEYIGRYGISQLRCDLTSTLRIHQAYTNCLSWYDLHLWWFVSLTYILRASDHAGKKGMVKSILPIGACTKCSSWHDLPMSRGGLFPWPIYATLGSPRLGRNYYVYIKVPEGATFTLLASSAHIASCHVSSKSAQRFQRRSRKSQKFKTTDRRQTCVQNSVFEHSVQVY